MKSSTFWKVHQKWKKMKKSLVQLALNPFFHSTSKTQISVGLIRNYVYTASSKTVKKVIYALLRERLL